MTRLIINLVNDGLASSLWSAQLLADIGIGGIGNELLPKTTKPRTR